MAPPFRFEFSVTSTVRKRIHEVAEKIYGNGDKDACGYILAAKDF